MKKAMSWMSCLCFCSVMLTVLIGCSPKSGLYPSVNEIASTSPSKQADKSGIGWTDCFEIQPGLYAVFSGIRGELAGGEKINLIQTVTVRNYRALPYDNGNFSDRGNINKIPDEKTVREWIKNYLYTTDLDGKKVLKKNMPGILTDVDFTDNPAEMCQQKNGGWQVAVPKKFNKKRYPHRYEAVPGL